jgi:hypothetical protein
MTTPEIREAKYASLLILLYDALQLPFGRRQPDDIIAAVRALREKADNNPCKSCGADPSVYPETGEELPIVRGALDAQGKAEAELFAVREAVAQHPERMRRLVVWIAAWIRSEERDDLYESYRHYVAVCEPQVTAQDFRTWLAEQVEKLPLPPEVNRG